MAFSDRVLAALGENLIKRAGPQLPDLVNAYTTHADDVDALTSTTPRGWPTLVDLDTTPYPDLLGAALGSRVPAGLTKAQQRAYIRQRPRWRRGTAGSIEAAVAAVAPGVRVDLFERDGSPWALTVRVTGSDIQPATLAAIRREVEAQKPAGIVLTFETVAGASYAHMTQEHGPTYADYQARFSTFAAAIQHVPEEGTTP